MSEILLLIGFLFAVALLVYLAVLAVRYRRVHASFRGWSQQSGVHSISYALAGLSNLFVLFSQLCAGVPEQKKAQFVLIGQALLSLGFLFCAWLIRRAQRQVGSN